MNIAIVGDEMINAIITNAMMKNIIMTINAMMYTTFTNRGCRFVLSSAFSHHYCYNILLGALLYNTYQ